MKMKSNRRKFFKTSISALAGFTLASASADKILAGSSDAPRVNLLSGAMATIRFSVIGLNHGHIYGQTEAVIRNGGELVSFYAKEPDLVAAFQKRYPKAKLAGSEAEILEDKSIQLVVSASIPVERAPLGIRVMQHGKDFMADKPGITTLQQLAEVRKVQKETKRIYSIMYSERFENRATVKAGELVHAGAIGQVIQTIGLGPHRMNIQSRPSWFFDKKYYGGISPMRSIFIFYRFHKSRCRVVPNRQCAL